MISLAELRSRNVTPIWQEAVAVVQELIQTVKATTGSAELLPDLEHVALIPNGDVVALPGSPEPAVPVRHAAVMLKLLVDGIPVPPELEQFVTRNVSEPPQYDSVAEFSRNLAFFERPGRRSDVERLVGRALAAEQTSRAEEELKRLKERASEVTHAMEPPEFLQERKRPQTVPIALVAGIGVLVIGAGLWLLQRVRSSHSSAATSVSAPAKEAAAASAAQAQPADGSAPPSGAATAPADATALPASDTTPAGAPASGVGVPAGAAQTTPATGATAAPVAAPPAQAPRTLVERASDAVRSAVNTLVGSGQQPPSPATATDLKPTTATKMASPPRSASRRTSKPVTPTVAAAPPAPAEIAPRVATAVDVPPPVLTPAPEMLEPLPEEAIAVFTSADSTVTPAVIVRPVLPKAFPPGVPPEKIGTMEVVVDEQGDVLHVKLVSPANRYHERMLVSAAKMWKFRPAYKDGRPVRYKTQVRLTI
jgi:hypothetical protein